MAGKLEKLLREKADRLSEIPDRLLTAAEKAERELFRKLIALLGQLKTRGDLFVSSRENLEIAAQILEGFKEEFYLSSYADAVEDFAAQFEIQMSVSDRYFSEVFPEYSTSLLAREVVEKTKAAAVELLLGAEAESSFFSAIKETLETSVISGASYKDTIESLTPLFEGEEGGKIRQYSSQIAHDSFALADRTYMSVVSDELEAEWFKYSGGTIATSRPFCVERHEQFFHYKEIEGWPDGERQPGQRTPTNDGTWAGMIPGTSPQNIYSYLGGFNCRHSPVPVSIIEVPRDVIERNIASGNFTPSKFEVEELGL